MVPERRPVERRRDAASAQISLGDRTRDRPAGVEQAAGSIGRSAARGRSRVSRGAKRSRQREEGARLVDGFSDAAETAIEADQVEEIAMLGGGCVGLMFNCT